MPTDDNFADNFVDAYVFKDSWAFAPSNNSLIVDVDVQMDFLIKALGTALNGIE